MQISLIRLNNFKISCTSILEKKKKLIEEINKLKNSDGIIEVAPDKFMCFN